ncbi:hypothetical protein PUN28_000183 [Cardiocondyla obscurior]|uniref:Uncharacterized protein n=1 Tax=Cardiocondyla obscurior TaxID=286306 RepID=A0AAW2GY38_9HYME
MRECLGCETYAKCTHTRVSLRVLCPRSSGPSFLRLVESTGRAHGSRVRACSLYGARAGSPSTAAAVVPGGIRNDTSPMSSRRLGMSRRPPLATHRWPFARFIVHARRLTTNHTVRLLYGLCLYKRRK